MSLYSVSLSVCLAAHMSKKLSYMSKFHQIWLRFATLNLPSKFQVYIFTSYKDMNGNAKRRKNGIGLWYSGLLTIIENSTIRRYSLCAKSQPDQFSRSDRTRTCDREPRSLVHIAVCMRAAYALRGKNAYAWS